MPKTVQPIAPPLPSRKPIGAMDPMIIKGLALIYVFTVAAWVALGTSIINRTQSKYKNIGERVEGLWGTEHVQVAPNIHYKRLNKNGVEESVPVELESSAIDVDLALDYRKKGLLWYSTYRVAFDGTYSVINPFSEPKTLYVRFHFPAEQTIYDNFKLIVDGKKIQPAGDLADGVEAPIMLAGGGKKEFRITYKSQGRDCWKYRFGSKVKKVRNFRLVAKTDFMNVDFPEQAISPTHKEQVGKGWNLKWAYEDLVAGFDIGIEMPEKMNPGPMASRITFFAPVGLLAFMFILLIVSALKNIRIHPMNYLFVAAGFFAFHLLFAYLVDHVSLLASFAVSALVSLLLVISYLRLVVGLRFAIVHSGTWQLIFLVLFSYAFFFPGYTGLLITIGCIVTLAVMMQMTGRIDWWSKFGD